MCNETFISSFFLHIQHKFRDRIQISLLITSEFQQINQRLFPLKSSENLKLITASFFYVCLTFSYHHALKGLILKVKFGEDSDAQR